MADRLIMHLVVDHANCIMFVRAYDEARIPASLRYPAVQGANFLDAAPQVHREGFATVLQLVRHTGQPQVWQFPSAVIPGELRILQAHSAPGQLGSVTISILQVPCESEGDDLTADTATG